MQKCEFCRKGAETPKRKKRNETVVVNGKGTGVFFPTGFAAETLILVLRDMRIGSRVRPFRMRDKKNVKRKKKSRFIISDTLHSFKQTNYVRLQCNLLKILGNGWERTNGISVENRQAFQLERFSDTESDSMHHLEKASKWSTVFFMWCFVCHRYHQWNISSRQNKRIKKSRLKKMAEKRKEGRKTLDGGMNEKKIEHISSRHVVNAKQSLWYAKVEQKSTAAVIHNGNNESGTGSELLRLYHFSSNLCPINMSS